MEDEEEWYNKHVLHLERRENYFKLPSNFAVLVFKMINEKKIENQVGLYFIKSSML